MSHPWPASIRAWPYCPHVHYVNKRGNPNERSLSSTGFIDGRSLGEPRGLQQQCCIKTFAFWVAPDGVVHMSLLSNQGHGEYEYHGATPHEVEKGLFCDAIKWHGRRRPRRCEYVYELRATCPTCIKGFEMSMIAYEKWRVKYDEAHKRPTPETSPSPPPG